jgi:hypothetical protein
MAAAGTIMVCQLVGASRRSDVDLDHDQFGAVIQVEVFDMLILDRHFVVGVEIGGECCQPQRGKE